MINILKLGAETSWNTVDEWITTMNPPARRVLALRFENRLELWAFTNQGYYIPKGAELIKMYDQTEPSDPLAIFF